LLTRGLCLLLACKGMARPVFSEPMMFQIGALRTFVTLSERPGDRPQPQAQLPGDGPVGKPLTAKRGYLLPVKDPPGAVRREVPARPAAYVLAHPPGIIVLLVAEPPRLSALPD
jgi:hypothetical protein